MDLIELRERAALAARWLADTAQKTQGSIDATCEDAPIDYLCQNWSGSLRSSYFVATGRWLVHGGTWWHTGQAVKALTLYHQLTADRWSLDAAARSVNFIMRSQLADDDPDSGLICAEEDIVPEVLHHASASAQLECLDGLLTYAEATGQAPVRQAALAALDWIGRHLYVPGGWFEQYWDLDKRRSLRAKATNPPILPEDVPGRPLLDDAMFLKGWRLNGRDDWRDIFFETADRLVADGQPPVNWGRYSSRGRLHQADHPRHAFWWGLPMWDAYQETNEHKYLEQVVQAGDWLIKAVRHDGGMFRESYYDGSTDSFGHATSGTACAAILWSRLWHQLADDKYLSLIARSLRYCMDVQFTHPQDENLTGAVLEKVLPPNGTDRNPYEIRTIGTVFFLMAAVQCLLDEKLSKALDGI